LVVVGGALLDSGNGNVMLIVCAERASIEAELVGGVLGVRRAKTVGTVEASSCCSGVVRYDSFPPAQEVM
jgi:hypothetical protein